MALLMNDLYGGGQEEVKLGNSRITPRETYGASASGIQAKYADNMKNVDSLVSSLSGLSRSIGDAEQKQRELDDQQALVNRDLQSVKTDAQTGGAGGGLFRFITGNGGPSPSMQIKLQEYHGQKAFGEAIQADPEYQRFVADNNVWSNRDEAVKRFNEIAGRVQTEYFQQNPNVSQNFKGGWAQSFTSASQSASSAALQKQIAETQKIAELTARQEADKFHSGAGLWQSRSHTIATEMGVDPAKIAQIIAVENPNWNPNAESPTGVRGISQITQGRYEEIVSRIRKENPELAAKMKDRSDPESALIAVTHEYKRMEQVASDVLGKPARTSEAYLLWNLGEAGAKPILNAIRSGQTDVKIGDIAVNLTDVNNNSGLYGQNGSRTVGEAMNLINAKMKTASPYHNFSTPVQAMKGQTFTEQTGIPEGSTQYNYKWTDFKNSGVMGGAGQLDSRIVQVLDQASQFLGYKVMPVSGHRSPEYNAEQPGAAKNSQHIHGNALDIAVTDPEKQLKLAKFLSSIGVTGIGVYKGHMHIDIGDREASWSKGSSVSQEQLQAAISEGRSLAGTFRPAGFNGTTRDPMQTAVQDSARRNGLAPSQARSIFLDSLKTSAEEAANRGNIAQSITMLSDAVRNYGPSMTSGERNTLFETQRNVSDVGIRLYEHEQKMKQIDADKGFQSEFARASKLQAEGKPFIPDTTKFNMATPEGQAAYAKAKQVALFGTDMVTTDVSKGNLGIAKSKFYDKSYMKELGFDEGKTPTKEEFRSAALRKYKGQLSLADLNDLTDAYDAHRVRMPLAESEATRVSALQKGNLSNLLSSNSAYLTTIARTFEGNPRGLEQKLSDHTDMLVNQFQKVFSYWYTKEMESTGQQPSGEALNAIIKRTMETMQGDAQALAARVVGQSTMSLPQGATPEQINAQRMQNPADVFDPRILTQQALGLRAPEKAIPEIPGARMVVGPNGQPVMQDGSYVYKLPDGTNMYYNPTFEAAMAAPSTITNVAGEAELPAFAPRQQPAAPVAPAKPAASPANPERQQVEQNRTYSDMSKLVRGNTNLPDVISSVRDYIEQHPARREYVQSTIRDLIHSNDPELRKLSNEISRLETSRLPTREQQLVGVRQQYETRVKNIEDALITLSKRDK